LGNTENTNTAMLLRKKQKKSGITLLTLTPYFSNLNYDRKFLEVYEKANPKCPILCSLQQVSSCGQSFL
jgi:hypothetical protein